MPQSLNVIIGALGGFTKDHAGCKERTEVEPTSSPAQLRSGWAASRDTGTSSFTIWSVMTRQHSPHGIYAVPIDPADFGRCYRLLELYPEWRERLGEVAAKYPDWKALVAHWDELVRIYEEELPSGKGPKLYALMQRLIEEGKAEL